jgi:hypothetical protein
MRKTTKLVAVAAAVAAEIALVGTSSAFTDSNTVPDSTAGYGTAHVTGITVSAVHYVQNASDASLLDTVIFDTSDDITTVPQTSTLTLEFSAGSPQIFSCSNAAGVLPADPNTITCAVTGTAIASVTGTDLTVSNT